MRPAGSLPIAKPLSAGWGPVIYFQDEYYPGRVLECEPPVEPGQSGEAIIGVMATQADQIGLNAGATFELREGPTTVIATATVLDVSTT